MLARHALDVFEQFALDLALGAGTDAMDRFDQQVVWRLSCAVTPGGRVTR
jgi:hypothetical protein